MAETIRYFTPDELARYDGREGRSAYIAYRGMVYDVTGMPNWRGGEHCTEHLGGSADVADRLRDAPHGDEVFDLVPIVGVLVQPPGPGGA